MGKSVGLTREAQKVGVLDDPIKKGGGKGRIGDHLPPFIEKKIRSDNDGMMLVECRDNLEEQLRRSPFNGDIAELIKDKQVKAF